MLMIESGGVHVGDVHGRVREGGVENERHGRGEDVHLYVR